MKSTLVVALLSALLAPVALAEPPADFGRKHGKRISFDHGDAKINDFGRLIAEAMKIPYYVEQTPKGPIVWMAPSSDEEAMEIQMRLSQYVFVVKACDKPELVTPQTPAGTVKSC